MARHLVTGAGSGIGSVVASALLERGDDLVLLARSQERAEELSRHYDGAVVLVADLADIGAMFPAGDPQWKGASSLDLLARAYAAVGELGFELVNADCILIGEEPRLAPHRLEMRTRLSAALGVDELRVAVRATTTDGLGFTGRGEGLAAQSVALLVRA